MKFGSMPCERPAEVGRSYIPDFFMAASVSGFFFE